MHEVRAVKRRTKWILGLSVGIPVLLIGVLLLVLQLSSPTPRTELSIVEPRALPETPVIVAPDPSETAETSDEIAPEPTPSLATLDLPIQGTLVMEGDGKPFGEERYELAYEEGLLVLRSDGRFWFKALIATINLVFDQTLHWDDAFQPLDYTASFDAPLGFGRNYQASFGDEAAQIQVGDDSSSFVVSRDRAFILGTFSTYAIVPLIDAVRSLEVQETYDTLMFGGPPGQSQEDAEGGLPQMGIRRIEDVVILSEDQEIAVARFEISSNMGSMFLYALGIEFLGLYAGEEGDSLFIYRADYFPNGFEIVNAATR